MHAQIRIFEYTNSNSTRREKYICNSSFNVPTKMVKFCREKGVLITTYEEMPRRKRVSASQHQQHHHHLRRHHHHHHYLHNASPANQYNRRAELLRYSERLREAARPTLLQQNPTPPNNQQPATTSIAVHRRKNSARIPNCLGNWKILIPSFVRPLTSPEGKRERGKKKQSGSTTNKMKALMKSFQVQKMRGFLPKLFSALRKHR